MSREPSFVPSSSAVPSESSVPSLTPTESSKPSDSPSISQQPSSSSLPSLAPSNSPRVTSVTVIEPDGVSKTVECCDDGEDNNDCQALLAISKLDDDECSDVAPSTSEQPSLVPSTHPSVEPSNVPSESGVPSLMVSVCLCFLRLLMTLFRLLLVCCLITQSLVSYIAD